MKHKHTKCKHELQFYLYLKLLLKNQTYFALLHWYKSAVSVWLSVGSCLTNPWFSEGLAEYICGKVQNIAGWMETSSQLLAYVPKYKIGIYLGMFLKYT